MPKGVICGGAVDGSNQAGEIVTCQAMTAWPDGARPAASDPVAPTTRAAAASNEQMNAKRDRNPRNKIIRPLLNPVSGVTPEPRIRGSSRAIVGHFDLCRQ